jgi:hypothetical protein
MPIPKNHPLQRLFEILIQYEGEFKEWCRVHQERREHMRQTTFPSPEKAQEALDLLRRQERLIVEMHKHLEREFATLAALTQ